MITKSIKIQIHSGLEARPVAMLVQVASKYTSRIYLECGTTKVNAKSIMGMMALGLSSGDEVKITADGSDEEDAMNDITNFLTNVGA
ncbi:MAG: HPr family phosphocarrier protein [Lachnospiraceae bacterium]|jgi:phosphotransferase system HPr (HPr) family protein|nr:HPr family phosphocarrier protein [Lachnospiraceae bacterium]MEE3461355.1 HPr family phosphocarrier protein [Lachnospiraceae bacterium]